MNANARTMQAEETKVGVRIKLSALWIAMMLLYIYADIFSFYRPGAIEKMMAGRMGPFPVTPASLLTASILMVIPPLMILLSLSLKRQAARWTNIILGVLYTLVNISNLIGETWAYYILSGVVELALTLLIVGKAWTWRNPTD